MTDKELIDTALGQLKNSYSPYSNFKVSAALITKSGKIFTGVNVENSAFSATTCAERTAFIKAISDGDKDFSAIAVVGGKNGEITDFCPPCGVCRQIMQEFCKPDFRILLFNGSQIKSYTLSQLLPESFGRDNLC